MGDFVLKSGAAMLLAEAGDKRLDITGLEIDELRRR
jgi:hypothetical protein